MFDKLSAPFPPEAIHWRAQTVTRNGDKALALAYIDARDVMDRLDAVCGPANWRDSFFETAKGRTFCTLEIRVDNEWIAKSDGAGDTDVEGEKGSISDALKRAAVKWGIGRYLYDLGNVWAPCESNDVNGRKKWVKWAAGADRVFADALGRLSTPVKQDRPTGQINDKTRANVCVPAPALVNEGHIKALRETMREAGLAEAKLLGNLNLSEIEEMTVAQYEFAIGKMNETIEKSKQKEAA